MQLSTLLALARPTPEASHLSTHAYDGYTSYAWKGAKWIHRIELLTRDRPGYRELRGYSNTAHPWRNDRYS